MRFSDLRIGQTVRVTNTGEYVDHPDSEPAPYYDGEVMELFPQTEQARVVIDVPHGGPSDIFPWVKDLSPIGTTSD